MQAWYSQFCPTHPSLNKKEIFATRRQYRSESTANCKVKMPHALSVGAVMLTLGTTISADTYPGYEYGNYFYLGPTTGGQYITKATYSLVPPSPPTDYRRSNSENTWLSLWIGVQDNPNTSSNVLDMDFVQPLLNWGPDNQKWLELPSKNAVHLHWAKRETSRLMLTWCLP